MSRGRAHKPLTGTANTQPSAANSETANGKDSDTRHEPDKALHKPATTNTANGNPAHHSNHPTSQIATGNAK